MKNFESQQFRDNLAKEIKEAPKEERKDILDRAKETPEYQQVRTEKVKERQEKEETVENKSQQEKTAEEFRQLFSTESFTEGYIIRATISERKSLDELAKKIEIASAKNARSVIEKEACKLVGVESPEDGKKKGREWGAAMKSAENSLKETGVSLDTEGGVEIVPFEVWMQAMSQKASMEFAEERDVAEHKLNVAEAQNRAALKDAEEKFLQAFNDPMFQSALDLWREAPSLDGSIKHAGLVHFIEYRSDTKKDGRFEKIPETFSPEGFIDYTQRLKHLIENPTSPDVKEALRLRDESGKERMLIYTPDNQFISAFRESEGETWKIVTHIPDVLPKQWEKTKTNMRDAASQAQYHNRLEGQIQEVSL